MNSTIAIFSRELKGFFNSPMAYIFLVIFALVNGYFFTNTFFLFGQSIRRRQCAKTRFRSPPEYRQSRSDPTRNRAVDVHSPWNRTADVRFHVESDRDGLYSREIQNLEFT